MMTRRMILSGGVATVALAVLTRPFWAPGTAPAAAAETFPVAFPEAEWRMRLSPEQFSVLRESGTERPFTSPLLDEHREGTFHCAGCSTEAFASSTKFDSGTGWPSFWAAIKGGVGEEEDRSFGVTRTAVHCSQCGGHLGHVFDDGPKPTGLRYCMNGVALGFTPAKA